MVGLRPPCLATVDCMSQSFAGAQPVVVAKVQHPLKQGRQRPSFLGGGTPPSGKEQPGSPSLSTHRESSSSPRRGSREPGLPLKSVFPFPVAEPSLARTWVLGVQGEGTLAEQVSLGNVPR